eukprot:CAMPEP_0196579070 /NCGR_PEP_ID=MMETSP1081-20130531/17480_1 /TAXON_ID=36882 /ORGANISM="Pyramimonas amylifera, Strain CCMP720" /LENGTH=366 /DNA_ID=CAMNT_0041898519 /DNA_START=87 /DNA_END=1187 /DNA_ORIENTATION=-
MPIPVSVTGFTNQAGSLADTSSHIPIETVPNKSVASNSDDHTKSSPAASTTVVTSKVVEEKSKTSQVEPLVVVNGLSFCYPASDGRPIPDIPPMITNMHLTLNPGECSLLLGANGAGKTTLLKILGGQHMIPREMVSVLGSPPFHETRLTMSGALSFIGGSWNREVAFAGNSIPLQGDFSAGQMITGIQGVNAERRTHIMEVLDINPDWRMHRVSDGQRRRVQLCIGLLREYKVLLLDEITVDLDVLGRHDLLEFLKKDAQKRGAVVLYATHIFDGLEDWMDSIAFIASGTLQFKKTRAEVPSVQEHGLLHTVAGWLRQEQEERLKKQSTENKTVKPAGTYSNNNGYSAGTLASTLAGSSNMVWRC